MKILVACEFSGIVSNAFRLKGHDVTSCDIIDSEVDGKHYKGDVFNIIYESWDLMIAHPPCTHLSSAGSWTLRYPERFPDKRKQRIKAVDFFLNLYNADIPKIAIENPAGCMSALFRKPDQYIHPYFFGDCQLKRTGLWLKKITVVKME